jgi:hypothetical protein
VGPHIPTIHRLSCVCRQCSHRPAILPPSATDRRQPPRSRRDHEARWTNAWRSTMHVYKRLVFGMACRCLASTKPVGHCSRRCWPFHGSVSRRPRRRPLLRRSASSLLTDRDTRAYPESLPRHTHCQEPRPSDYPADTLSIIKCRHPTSDKGQSGFDIRIGNYQVASRRLTLP